MRPKSVLRTAAAALLLLGAAICAAAQKKAAARPDEANGAPPSSAPAARAEGATVGQETVSYFYEFTQPEFTVHHVTVEHDAEGRGRVSFERQSDREAIVEKLELSPAALGRIKALWEALRFLESDAKYQSDKQLPHLGTMRLRMTRGTRTRTAEFNWTNDRDAFALVNEYRRAADQVMLVFEIGLARQLQPLETPKLMSRLDTMLERNGLSDPHQLLPLLRDLHTDESLPLIARNAAGRLLKKIQK